MTVCVGNDNDVRHTSVPEALVGHRQGRHFVDHTTASAKVARQVDADGHQARLQVCRAPCPAARPARKTAPHRDVRRHARRPMPAPSRSSRPMPGREAARAFGLGPADKNGQPDLHRRTGAGPVGRHLFRQESRGSMSQAVIDTISKGAAQSWQMENRYKTMNEGKYDFGFAVEWMRKDLSICLAESRAQRGEPSGHRAGGPVLRRSRDDGRQALGHLEPAGPAGALGLRASRRG